VVVRHRVKGKKLSRSTNARRALYKNLLTALFEKEAIVTTYAKAKAIQGQADKIINKARQGTLAARRFVYAFLNTKESTHHLFEEILPRIKGRKSGFTRIIKLGARRGDQAPMVRLELVDRAEKEEEKKEKKEKKKKEDKKGTEKEKAKSKPKPKKEPKKK